MRIDRDIGITDSLIIYEAKMPPGKGALDRRIMRVLKG